MMLSIDPGEGPGRFLSGEQPQVPAEGVPDGGNRHAGQAVSPARPLTDIVPLQAMANGGTIIRPGAVAWGGTRGGGIGGGGQPGRYSSCEAIERALPAFARAAEDPAAERVTALQFTWAPGTSDMLEVQVIGQQWTWTYRYPQFGGMESTELMLPVGMPVTFHVTSLDVIHSFWAYQLGVKADANPDVDNVAYVTPKTQGGFTVRCNELCGIWHGAMFNYGQVVMPAAFQSWASGVQAKEQADGVLAALPAYALTYDPTVIPQLGKNLPAIDGITGAAGYYYPPSDPVTP